MSQRLLFVILLDDPVPEVLRALQVQVDVPKRAHLHADPAEHADAVGHGAQVIAVPLASAVAAALLDPHRLLGALLHGPQKRPEAGPIGLRCLGRQGQDPPLLLEPVADARRLFPDVVAEFPAQRYVPVNGRAQEVVEFLDGPFEGLVGGR